MKRNHKEIIVKVVCFLYAILFLYAAFNKLLDYQKFQVQLGQSPIMSAYADWIAFVVPITEIVIALLLFYLPTRLIALYAGFYLMVMFTAYIFIILNFSAFVPCSCGGVLEKLGWKEHLIFNIVFVFLALTAILIIHSGKKANTPNYSVI